VSLTSVVQVTSRYGLDTLHVNRVLSLALLFIALLAPPATDVRAAPRGIHVAAGLDLSLSLPRSVYPRDALAIATVRLRNLSSHVMQLAAPCGDNPAVQVMSGTTGAIVFPPIFRASAGGSCHMRRHRFGVTGVLEPGSALVRQVFIILRGSVVRPTVSIVTGLGPSMLTGRALKLTLVDGKPPTFTLSTTPTLSATIRSALPVAGPLVYAELYRCGVDSEVTYSEHSGRWQFARGSRLVPHWPPNCAYPFEWHAVAGWPGQPVAHIDYVSG